MTSSNYPEPDSIRKNCHEKSSSDNCRCDKRAPIRSPQSINGQDRQPKFKAKCEDDEYFRGADGTNMGEVYQSDRESCKENVVSIGKLNGIVRTEIVDDPGRNPLEIDTDANADTIEACIAIFGRAI
jgi:hypothetical protein